MNSNNQTPPQTTKSNKLILPLIIGIVVLFLILGSVYLFLKNGRKQTPTQKQSAQSEQETNKTATLSTDPNEQATKNSEVTTYSIWVDSGEQKIATVEAILTYPVDKFDFVNIDDTGSGFGINAESKGGDGKITIAKGQLGGTTGKQLLAKVNLKAKTIGSGELVITNESKVLTMSNEPQNILSNTSGAVITIEE